MGIKTGDKVKIKPSSAPVYKNIYFGHGDTTLVNSYIDNPHRVIAVSGRGRWRNVCLEGQDSSRLPTELRTGWWISARELLVVESAPHPPKVPCNCSWEPCLEARKILLT